MVDSFMRSIAEAGLAYASFDTAVTPALVFAPLAPRAVAPVVLQAELIGLLRR